MAYLKSLRSSMSNKYLEKIAAPKWVKYLRELPSPKLEGAVLSIKGKVPNKVREISRVGKGGFQKADLVYHPKHGLSVRKTQLGHDFSKEIQDELVTSRADQHIGLWNKIKELSRGKGQFAHIQGSDGAVYYQQYINPGKKDPYSMLLKRDKSIRARLAEMDKGGTKAELMADKRYKGLSIKEILESRNRERSKLDTQLDRVISARHYGMKNKGGLNPETVEVLKKVESPFSASVLGPDPEAIGDLRYANFVGRLKGNGKLVDI